MSKTERKGEPDIYNTTDDDQEMNLAITTAKQTLDQFDKALISKKFDTSKFALKVKFPTAKGFEHIWAMNVSIIKGQYSGIINDVPDMATQVKLGDSIKIEKEDISDWLYSDNGFLKGGYTIRVLRNRMTKDEQNKFDSDFQLKIAD